MPSPGASPAWPYDWFHLNSIALAPRRQPPDLRPQHVGGLRPRPPSGQSTGSSAGREPSFTMGPGTATAWQHDAQPLGPRRSASSTTAARPRASATRAASSCASTRPRAPRRSSTSVAIATPIFAQTQGDLERLPDGDWWIGWGNVNESSEVARRPPAVRGAHAGRVGELPQLRFPWSGRPPPAAGRAARAASGPLRVYVSWNGATTVAPWRIESGSNASSVRPSGPAIDRSGFETDLAAPRGAATSRPRRWPQTAAFSRNGRASRRPAEHLSKARRRRGSTGRIRG